MLQGELIHPQILHALGTAGHGAKVLIADGNYPLITKSNPDAEHVYLNLAPGMVTVTDVLRLIIGVIPIEAAQVMGPDSDQEPSIFGEFRKLLKPMKLERMGRFDFYDAARGPDTALAIATGEQRIYANILLTIGVIPPPGGKLQDPNLKSDILNELIALSHHLGAEGRDYVIIGEGNTSARINGDAFFVKASGHNLGTITAEGFVEIDGTRVLEAIASEVSDEDITRALMEARVDPNQGARPSVETTLHAVLYKLTAANFIGHTHAVAANVLLCSTYATDIARHVMPDAIVVLGPHMVYVPYTDPGVPLTRAVSQRVEEQIATYGEAPRVVWLENHGVIALGESARQVENVMQMAVKHARVLAGARALGEPRWLSAHDIARIHTRPDEEVRRARFK